MSVYGERCRWALSVVCPDAARGRPTCSASSSSRCGAIIRARRSTVARSSRRCWPIRRCGAIWEGRTRRPCASACWRCAGRLARLPSWPKLPGRDFGYLLSQRGMFSYTGSDTARRSTALREHHSRVYLLAFGAHVRGRPEPRQRGGHRARRWPPCSPPDRAGFRSRTAAAAEATLPGTEPEAGRHAAKAVAAHHHAPRGKRRADAALLSRSQSGRAAGEIERVDCVNGGLSGSARLDPSTRPGALFRARHRRCVRHRPRARLGALRRSFEVDPRGRRSVMAQVDRRAGRRRPRVDLGLPRRERRGRGRSRSLSTVISRRCMVTRHRRRNERMPRNSATRLRLVDGVDQVPGGEVEIHRRSAPRAVWHGRRSLGLRTRRSHRQRQDRSPIRCAGRNRCRPRGRRGWRGCRRGGRADRLPFGADPHDREVGGAAADVDRPARSARASVPAFEIQAPRRSARTGRCSSVKAGTCRAAASSAAWARASRARRRRRRRTPAGRRTARSIGAPAAFGFGAVLQVPRDSRRRCRGRCTPRPPPTSVVCSTSELPRMLFIDRISRPSMPST